MEDKFKSREQLIRELEDLRGRIAFCQESEAMNEKTIQELFNSSENCLSILEASPD